MALSLMLTFKIEGQINRLPVHINSYKIYFMGKSVAEVDRRCACNPTIKRTIVQELQSFFIGTMNQSKPAFVQMPSDSYNNILYSYYSYRVNKTPEGNRNRNQ